MAKATKQPEVTTKHMASLAAKTLVNPGASPLEKKFAGALLTQAPDKPKKRIKK
ncbi:MAG: hypothetical protein ABIN94_09575 [Ferruginibacter sp.]